jgi:hypothetical protein
MEVGDGLEVMTVPRFAILEVAESMNTVLNEIFHVNRMAA